MAAQAPPAIEGTLPERGIKAEASGGGGASAPGASVQAQEGDDAPATTKDDDDEEVEGAVWETASLFEEILDDVAAFEYSSHSRCNCLTTMADS